MASWAWKGKGSFLLKFSEGWRIRLECLNKCPGGRLFLDIETLYNQLLAFVKIRIPSLETATLIPNTAVQLLGDNSHKRIAFFIW